MNFIITKADGYYVLTVPGFKEYKLFELTLWAIETEIVRIAKKHKTLAIVDKKF